MFRLVDEERDTSEKISSEDLMQIANLCNLCGICPCRDIRSAILDFKTEYADRHGLKLNIRMIQSVERIGKLGGAFPGLTNALLQHDTTRGVVQGFLGIHRDRRFPRFPQQSFDKQWGNQKTASTAIRAGDHKVAYFAGCTARYLFPDVARATLEVLQRNHVDVLVPGQRCCGMPTLLEGDRRRTTDLVREIVDRWSGFVDQGYDIICSCPTCAYMLKVVVSAGAGEHKLLRMLAESKGDFVDWPAQESMLAYVDPHTGDTVQVAKKYIERMIDRTSYFAGIYPEKRLKISENTYDAGEYLLKLHRADALDTAFEPYEIDAVYYPPCHAREQRLESPYGDLLNLIPGFNMAAINGNYCCGNAGIMGFKKEFHHNSIKIAGHLISTIRKLDPQLLTTECLSCRLQFQQLTNYRVKHPIEIIREAYGRQNG
jgi:glycerol-3-phosphate dehydrogenase subunit C